MTWVLGAQQEQRKIFLFKTSGTLRVTEKQPPSGYFTLVRSYYVYTSYERFHRQIVDIKGWQLFHLWFV